MSPIQEKILDQVRSLFCNEIEFSVTFPQILTIGDTGLQFNSKRLKKNIIIMLSLMYDDYDVTICNTGKRDCSKWTVEKFSNVYCGQLKNFFIS